ncbi:MAG: PA14 domain-containing protein [Thermoflexales bacterium]|nr:PA14 domain-containing protein [Thermoflexales bacterium]
MGGGRAFVRAILRIAWCVCFVVAITGVVTPAALLAAPDLPTMMRRPMRQERRVILSGVPDDIVPRASNIWQCACDNDGCWPGCFTIASATLLKYWSEHGYPALWDGNENATLQRLRELFPNLFCYNNVDDDGKISDSGYDAADVAKGLDWFVRERGYQFSVRAIYAPDFRQIVEQIDAGRPVIGAFGTSPWGSHAGTIIGYDATNGRRAMIVRPNLPNKPDTELEWGIGYGEFAIVTFVPRGTTEALEVGGGPSLSVEVIVNDGDPGFTVQGEWIAYPVGFADESRFAVTTDPSNLGPSDDTAVARWTPDLPFDGIWEVLAWMPREDTDDSAAKIATYRIVHAEGMSLVRRSQSEAQPGWMSLGAYPFVRGKAGHLLLGNRTGDYPLRRVWADAVKFVWRAPLIVRSEEGGPAALVINGRRHIIPDPQTFQALRLDPAHVREISPIALAQYGEEEILPSVMSAWIGQYFNNTLLSPPAAWVKADSTLNFRWNGAAPAANMVARDFSVRWTRYLAMNEGVYPFRVEALGGVRLWVDGKLEIDAWDADSGVYVAHDKDVRVTAGLHRIDIEYVNRGGNAQIRLANLPPNMPIVVEEPVRWSASPTATMRWADAGDPDDIGGEKPRRFFVTLWRESDAWRMTSGWITATEWTVTLPADGRYLWSVLASDGTANSDATPPREILIDRTPPWAQMLDATTGVSINAALSNTAATPVDAYRLITDANGNLIVEGVTPPADGPQSRSDSIAGDALPMLGNLPAVYLRWTARDMPRGSDAGLTYDIQAREIIRARTSYTLTTEEVAVPRIAYELILSGAQEITVPVVLTEVVVMTTVAPLVEFQPITDSAWITIATGLRQTRMIFIGTPGSAYEFRVRAVDEAGNAQGWYEGYSVQAIIDPRTVVYRQYVPNVMR